MDFFIPKVIETELVAFTTFFAVVGPINVAAIFAGLTAGMPAKHRQRTAIKGVLIAATILLLFAFCGKPLLGYLGITLSSLKIAGGILLLLVGINMVLAKSTGLSSTTSDEAEEASHKEDISVFPLATPLIAGAGTMVPAPAIRGVASGNTEMSSLWEASSASSDVVELRPVDFASTILMPTKSNKIPPAILSEERVIPKYPSRGFPQKAKSSRIVAAIKTPLIAVRCRCFAGIPAVRPAKIAATLIGPTTAKKVVNATSSVSITFGIKKSM